MNKQNFKVYVNQGYLTLRFDTKNTDIATGNVVTARIKYMKPDGTTGTWNDAVIESTVVKRIVHTNADIDQLGIWSFQPVVTVDGLDGPCEIVTIEFTDQLFYD